MAIPREVQKSGFHHLFDRKVRALQAVSKVVSKLNKVPPLTLPGWGDRSDNKQSVGTSIASPVSDIDLGEFACIYVDDANGQSSIAGDWCIVEDSKWQTVGKEGADNLTTPNVIVLPEHRDREREAAIFMRGEPVFSDIRQNVRRKTCYLNASLAAYLANKDSVEILKNTMTANEKSLCISLYHPDSKSDVSIETPLERDEKTFSYSKNGSLWVASFEKAFYAINAVTQASKSGLQPGRKKAVQIPQDLSVLDWCTLRHALESLPFVPSAFESPSSEPVQMLLDPDMVELVRANVQQKVPVILGSKSARDIDKTFAVTSGIPSNHAVAVIREAYYENNDGQKVEGVLLFDPHGDGAANQNALDALMNGQAQKNVNISNIPAITFVPWRELPDNFAEAVVAKGVASSIKKTRLKQR